MTVSDPYAGSSVDTRPTRHEAFFAYRRFRYLKGAAGLTAASIVLYIAVNPYGPRYGGGFTGYTLGTVGALLILWLTWFGYRKRTYAGDHGLMAARLSAHVYLGLALLVVATLHTGFRFGWNIHTLAYALMCVVIASGVFGVFTYVRYPRRMTANREGMTTQQMLSLIAGIDEELGALVMPLDDATVALIDRSVETTAIGGSAWRQLSGSYPECTTAAAIARMETVSADVPEALQEAWRQTRVKLDEKAALLSRVRRDVRYKAIMDVWLYLHVPLTFLLIAALAAHVVSVFFLW
jgi:hypothetical protein